MPRNYYCDFCHCSFPDNVKNRKKHNEGTTHLNNRKLHYDWYKDPVEFLQEQSSKLPCRHYQQHNYCEFGLLCKYSHIMMNPITGQLVYPPELIEWIHLQQTENSPILTSSKQNQRRYKLPSGWKVKDLPPSLKPPPSKNGYNWNQTGSWD